MSISATLLLTYKILTSLNLYQKITYPFQLITIHLINSIQNLIGIDVTIDNFNLIYSNNLIIWISPICIGIEQLIFFYFMISFFIAIDFKTKIKGLLTFAPIILMANLIRLFLIYPLSVIYSIETTWRIHDFIFIYGQGFFLLILVVIWYYFFVNNKYLFKSSRT